MQFSFFQKESEQLCIISHLINDIKPLILIAFYLRNCNTTDLQCTSSFKNQVVNPMGAGPT